MKGNPEEETETPGSRPWRSKRRPSGSGGVERSELYGRRGAAEGRSSRWRGGGGWRAAGGAACGGGEMREGAVRWKGVAFWCSAEERKGGG